MTHLQRKTVVCLKENVIASLSAFFQDEVLGVDDTFNCGRWLVY